MHIPNPRPAVQPALLSNPATRSAKRNRTAVRFTDAEGTSRKDALSPPSKRRIGFHRTLQERHFSLLSHQLILRARLLEASHPARADYDAAFSACREQDNAYKEASAAAAQQADEFVRATPELLMGWGQIVQDTQAFLERYAAVVERPVLPVTDSASTLTTTTPTPTPNPLASSSAAELFASDLCEGLFHGLTFDPAREYQAEWAVLVNSILASSPPSQGPGRQAHAGAQYWDHLFRHNTRTSGEVNKILYCLAIAQIERMAVVDRKVDEMAAASEAMRVRNLENAVEAPRLYAVLREKGDEMMRILRALPATQTAIEELSLQLIILSKAT